MAAPIVELIKGSNRVALAGLLSLTLLGGIAAGDYIGQSRHRSTVDEALSTVVKKDPLAPKRAVLERAAIEAILKASGDRWSNYFPVQSVDLFNSEIQGRYSGVGIWLRKNASGVLELSSVQPGSPAAAAGLKVRDLLVSVDGVSMATATVPAAVAALRGKPKSMVKISVERDQSPINISITRAAVLTGDVVATQIAPKILYLQVSAVSSHSADDVATALHKYAHSKGIILDLRDNPGGLIDVAVKLVSNFLNVGTVVSYSRKGEDDVILNSNNSSPDTAPMTVLINRSTASAAEVMAAALQDRNRAVLLGEKSYGKGTVQEVISLMDGSQIEVTIGKYRTPSGTVIDGVGVKPDLSVAESGEIAKALQVLTGLASLDASGKITKKWNYHSASAK